MGIVYGITPLWYMTGLFPGRFRALPKEKQIVLLRQIGEKTSPLRVRDVLLGAYPDQPPEQHELAHLIGEAGYKRFGPKGFDYCDSAFTYACFHGVILSAIKTHGYSPDVLATLSEQCNAAGKNETAKVSCAHGIGHGIMWVENYAYKKSLALCDSLFADAKLQFFCWDGASMENVVRRSEAATGIAAIPWKEDDIYFPCDDIASQYQPACVREHVFLVRLTALARDTDKVIAYCLHFSGSEVHKECFGALGGALNQDDPKNLPMIVHECLKVPMGYSVQCIGVAATHYAYAGEKSKGQDLCAAIENATARRGCMESVERVSGALYMIQSL
jgi:hypothetical protein